ncbi:MAG: PilN domain-containing protein [Moraxellaceae bacterium]|nr:PilN domain-containing protein [Pseudobdellovibrionaceae bacterium]
MIKINLLKSFAAGSSESTQIAEEQNNVKASFFKNLLVIILGVGALYGYETVTIPELKSQLATIQAEINEASTFNQKMGALKKDIEKYEKDLKRLNSQTEFLQKVQKERLLSVDLINKMRETVSAKVWLNSIVVSGSSIEIKGESESISDVNEFNARLSGTTYLKDVLTTSIERKVNVSNNFQLQTFNIKASFVDGKQLIDDQSPDQAGQK